MKKGINYRLSFYELVFAMLVVFVHVSYSHYDHIFDSFGRSTVLFFFIISGYFFSKSVSKENFTYKMVFSKLLKFLIITVSLIVIYTLFGIVFELIINGPFNLLDFSKYLEIAMPQTSFLWFLLSLSLCYLIFPLINKIKWLHTNKKSIYIPLIILLFAYIYRLFAGKFDLGLLSGLSVTRNAFLTGLPCFMIGAYLRDFSHQYKQIDKTSFLVTFLLLFVGVIFEALFHFKYSGLNNEFYISSIVLCSLVLLYSIQNPNHKVGELLHKEFVFRPQTFIFYTHCLVIFLLSFMPNILIFDFLKVVISISLPFALIYVVGKIARRIKTNV